LHALAHKGPAVGEQVYTLAGEPRVNPGGNCAMRIVLQLGVIALCFPLFACGSLLRWPDRVRYDTFKYESLVLRPPVHPYFVQVFLFETPASTFETIGTLRLREVDGDCRNLYAGCRQIDRAYLEKYIPYVRGQAGKRGADLVWIQSDTVKEETCTDYDPTDYDSSSYTCYFHVLEGILGRRRE
jgi:hypothetical protein